MNKSVVLLFVIIGVMTVLGFANSHNGGIDDKVETKLVEGVQYVIDVAEFSKQSWSAGKAEKERLAELGYPDGYDPMNPIANGEFTEEDWDAIQQEDAMRSLAEDAMNEYYWEEPDISDHVLKP